MQPRALTQRRQYNASSHSGVVISGSLPRPSVPCTGRQSRARRVAVCSPDEQLDVGGRALHVCGLADGGERGGRERRGRRRRGGRRLTTDCDREPTLPHRGARVRGRSWQERRGQSQHRCTGCSRPLSSRRRSSASHTDTLL